MQSKSFSYQLARLISYVCHPLLMPTYGILLVFNSGTYLEFRISTTGQWVIIGLVFFSTFLMPFIYALFSLKQGSINSLHMETKEERHVPYFFTAMMYASTAYLIQKMGLSPIINRLFFGATAAIIIALLINTRWKISAHMMGIGGLIGATMGISYLLNLQTGWFLVSIILLAGFVGFARLKMNAHSEAQVYVGFILGVLSQVGLLFI